MSKKAPHIGLAALVCLFAAVIAAGGMSGGSRTASGAEGGGYFGRKTGTTSIEVTGGHAGGSKFTLPTGQRIARMGILGYMQNSPADGTLALYKDTAVPDVKQYVCHTVTGALPVGAANKAWTVLEVAGGPVWLDAGDYWILRNDSGNYSNKFVITGEPLDSNKWGWCYMDYPTWYQNTQYRTWVENFSNVEGCLYAEWDPGLSLASLVPETANAGDPGFTLSVVGTGFAEGAVVTWDGADRPTTRVSSSELGAAIEASDIGDARTVLVTVRNLNGEISNPLSFTVTSPMLPAITSLFPPSATAGDPGFTLIVTGTAFTNGTIMKWDGVDRPTTFLSGTEVSSIIGAAEVAQGRSVQVTVHNPGSGTSNALEFTIDNPSPILGSVYPAKATAGESGLIPTLSGSSFVPNSIVRWNGSDRTTTFVSGTELQAVIPAGDIALAGEGRLTVFNPAPAGGLSSSLPFFINNPRPVLGSLSPAKADAGSSGFDLILTGSSFVPGAVVLWGGSTKAASCVSRAELRASILASDIASGGELQVTVSNPAPAEGTSNALAFPVSSFAMGPSPTTATVTAGQSAVYDIQVTPRFGSFDSPVSFTCAGLPSRCTASFSPDHTTPGSGNVSTTLKLTTEAASSQAGAALKGGAGAGFVVVVLASLISAFWPATASPGRSRRRILRRLVPALAVIGIVLLTGSCGAISTTGSGTPKGSYQVTVEGRSGSLTVSTVVTLVVK